MACGDDRGLFFCPYASRVYPSILVSISRGLLLRFSTLFRLTGISLRLCGASTLFMAVTHPFLYLREWLEVKFQRGKYLREVVLHVPFPVPILSAPFIFDQIYF
jgi:hypothetical protein